MRVWLLTVCFAVGLVGCVQPPQGPIFPPIPYFIYTVRHEAEPLALIAKWYTGASENARALITHNPQLNPTAALAVGDQIRIPEMMLITRKAIPEEVFAKLKAKVARRPGNAAPSTADNTKRKEVTPTVTPKSAPQSTVGLKPSPQATPKLETFDSESDQPEQIVTPSTTAISAIPTSSATFAPLPTAIALSPEEQKIFEKSVQPAKSTISKSTYEQMQEALGK